MTASAPAGSNWAGNVTYTAPAVHEPSSVEELQELVAASPRIRALGTRHSFSLVADAPVLVSLARLPPQVEVDAGSARATVSAGMRWGDVATALQAQGLALRNMGSLPHIGVAGAVATGTHGSGDMNGNLATSVTALEVVGPDGELRHLSRASDPETFAGSVVSLGALGVVTAVTLDVVPSYTMRQDVYEDLLWSETFEHLDEIMADGYSVSLFTTWGPEGVDQVWRKRVVDEHSETSEPEGAWRGTVPASVSRHPLPGLPGTACTQQLGVPGPWHERLPHFRLDMTPSSGDELQSEYFVDRTHGPAAVETLYALRDVITPVLQVSEIRSVAADDLWLSPAYERDCLGLHFTWVRDQPAVERVLEVVEAALAPYDARPHWGKVFVMAPTAVAAAYPRFDDMRALVADHDPTGVFRNDFLDTFLPAPDDSRRGAAAHSRSGSSGTV